jgi:hypothetical protein
MARTTVNIDAPVLRDLKRLQKKTGRPLGRLISELLAKALAGKTSAVPEPPEFFWTATSMGVPRVDLRDKAAIWAVLDADVGVSETE